MLYTRTRLCKRTCAHACTRAFRQTRVRVDVWWFAKNLTWGVSHTLERATPVPGGAEQGAKRLATIDGSTAPTRVPPMRRSEASGMDAIILYLLLGLGVEIVFILDVLVLRLLMKQDGGFHLRFELRK